MAYKISDNCLACDSCRPQCPTGAITVEDGRYSIDPDTCNNCVGYFPEPQCVVSCPISLPSPVQAKKGRSRLHQRPLTSSDLFINGKNTPFASAIPVWEASNLLAQRQSLPWQVEPDGDLSYQRTFSQNYAIALRLSDHLEEPSSTVVGEAAIAGLDHLDLRAACLHLVYAAYATTLDRPWEQDFVISDRQIEEYLGLDKRKDLNKAAKLTLIKEIAQQPCLLKLQMNYPAQGRIKAFDLEKVRLWHLVDIQHHFQEDETGCKHLIGLTFTIRAGLWAKYFLNKQGCKERTAFYQYGTLPKSLLSTVMSIWQQHEGAARLLLWLLFKTRLGKEQRLTVPTLLRVAYGEEKVIQATTNREERKRLIRTFESDLEALNHYGLKPVFDPVTYPPEIQPLWARSADIPDDADDALEFWINDGSSHNRLTDASPRGKWNLLINARILSFLLPSDWEQPADIQQKKQRSYQRQRGRFGKTAASLSPAANSLSPSLNGQQVVAARQSKGWSQRRLAEIAGKSQSWIRDIENGRFQAKAEDQELLRRVLGMG